MNQLIKAKISSKTIQERKMLDWLWFGIVFLFSINLFDKAIYLLLGLLIIGLIISNYKNSNIKFTMDLLLIIIFCISYFFIIILYKSPEISLLLLYFIAPIGCFFIGYATVKVEKIFIIKTLIVLAVGNFMHGSLNMINYINANGLNSLARRVPDIWNGIEIAATIQGSYFTLVSSLFFYGLLIFRSQKGKLLSLIIIFATIFSLFSTVILGSRTLILLFLIILGLNIVLNSFFTKSIKFIKMLFLIITSCAIIFIVYSNNLFGIKDFIINSELYIRMETTSLSEDPRTMVYQRAISQMFDYPLGGYKMSLGLSYAHNLWMDVLYATGLIPFVFLILYTLKSIQNIISILNNKDNVIEFKILVTSIYIAYILNFMVEPILEGMPFMFLSFCLFNGMVRKYVDVSKYIRI
jgi:hypothetical protein